MTRCRHWVARRRKSVAGVVAGKRIEAPTQTNRRTVNAWRCIVLSAVTAASVTVLAQDVETLASSNAGHIAACASAVSSAGA